MNIVFWLLIVIILVAIWFSSSFLFTSFGEFLKGIWDNTKEELEDKGDI